MFVGIDIEELDTNFEVSKWISCPFNRRLDTFRSCAHLPFSKWNSLFLSVSLSLSLSFSFFGTNFVSNLRKAFVLSLCAYTWMSGQSERLASLFAPLLVFLSHSIRTFQTSANIMKLSVLSFSLTSIRFYEKKKNYYECLHTVWDGWLSKRV